MIISVLYQITIAMKKMSLLLTMLALVISSCSKNDNTTTPNQDLVDKVSDGTWSITYFYHNEMELTGDFGGYSFTFGSSNVLTASNGTNNYTGTWSVVNSDLGDDTPESPHFIIAFASPDGFAELYEDWNIVRQSTIKLELAHLSGGNPDGIADYLTFEKN